MHRYQPDDQVFYAHLTEHPDGHPLPRVLVCRVTRLQPNGKYRLKHPSTKFGYAAHPRHLARFPDEAEDLLTRRVGERIEQHIAAIRNLKDALRRHRKTATIVF